VTIGGMNRPHVGNEPLLRLRELAKKTGFRPSDIAKAAAGGVVPSILIGRQRWFLLSAFTDAVRRRVAGDGHPASELPSPRRKGDRRGR
jgi:hypothetical protein